MAQSIVTKSPLSPRVCVCVGVCGPVCVCVRCVVLCCVVSWAALFGNSSIPVRDLIILSANMSGSALVVSMESHIIYLRVTLFRGFEASAVFVNNFL